ncbi:MAG: TRAP transporter substrate-binding protein DctP [Spirochaetes bacterium]|nr:TRAP transporter substrate-binding protein DctP [Spirochaetota bacterium]
MKKFVVAILMLSMVLGMAAAAPAPIKLRLSEIHMEGYPTTLADREFARMVNEKTNGRIVIDVFANGVLNATEAEGIEALVLGELGFARVSAAPVAEFVPDLNAIQLPFLYKNSEHMWAVLNGQVGQDMLAKIQSSGSGLIGLCWYDAGSRCYYLTKKITTPKEMAGLKIRMQDNKMMVRMTELLGGVSVTGIGSNDIYPSIVSGIIDGAENNWPTYDTKGDYKAAKYYILDYHTRVPEILLMSEASMKMRKVSAQDLEIIKQCAKATQEYEIAQWKAMEKKSEANVRAGGTIVVELTPAQMQLFQDAMVPLYKEYGAKYQNIINAIADVGKKF